MKFENFQLPNQGKNISEHENKIENEVKRKTLELEKKNGIAQINLKRFFHIFWDWF